MHKSADLEITAYVLLAKLHRHAEKDLAELVSVARWINTQRNSLGGFYSTQDTVIALDALAKFSAASFSRNSSLKVIYSIRSSLASSGPSDSPNVVYINDRNRLLVQKVKLDKVAETGLNVVEFRIEGQGTSLVQVVAKFNTQTSSEKRSKHSSSGDGGAFEFSAFEAASTKNGDSCKRSELSVQVRYIGGQASGMAIVAIRLPTGWQAHEPTVQALRTEESVRLKRYELNENKMSLYFDEVSPDEGKVFKFEIERVFEVANAKPGLISVYDYYEPMEEAVTQTFDVLSECD